VQEGFGAVLNVIERDEDQDGFEVLPQRQVAGRTSAWRGSMSPAWQQLQAVHPQ
jgi:hypothetical protein